jgi:hypothetical protein
MKGMEFKGQMIEINEHTTRLEPNLLKAEDRDLYRIVNTKGNKYITVDLTELKSWEDAYYLLDRIMSFNCKMSIKREFSEHLIPMHL